MFFFAVVLPDVRIIVSLTPRTRFFFDMLIVGAHVCMGDFRCVRMYALLIFGARAFMYI